MEEDNKEPELEEVVLNERDDNMSFDFENSE